MLRIPPKFDSHLEELIHRTIGCCIEVHRQLGPGLLEAIYQQAVEIELEAAGIKFERERPFAVCTAADACTFTGWIWLSTAGSC